MLGDVQYRRQPFPCPAFGAWAGIDISDVYDFRFSQMKIQRFQVGIRQGSVVNDGNFTGFECPVYGLDGKQVWDQVLALQLGYKRGPSLFLSARPCIQNLAGRWKESFSKIGLSDFFKHVLHVQHVKEG